MDTYLFLLVALFVALALFTGFRPGFRRRSKHARGIVRGSRAQERARVH
jgi:hypothetical protein